MKEMMKCGIEKKYTVIKDEDIECLLPKEQANLARYLYDIKLNRMKCLKNPVNEYIVINTDEPYINDIIDILKKNNAWG